MRSFYTRLLSLFTCVGFCFASLTSIAQQQYASEYGEKFKLYSGLLKDTMETLVYLPENYERSGAKYPVIYLLDGKYYFPFGSQAMKILSDAQVAAPCIVVGITSRNRERDFTTPKSNNWNPPVPMPAAGGIDAFMDYLEKELVPAIEKKYRCEPYRIIAGHSLGGIAAMYSLYQKPSLFNAIIYVDGSLWWNEGEVGKAAIRYLTDHPAYKGQLHWYRDKIPHEVWFPINQEMYIWFNEKRPQGLNFSFTELENETHSTIIYPAIYMGIKEIFKGYSMPFNERTNLAAMMSYYDSLSGDLGYIVKPPSQIYNNLQGQLNYLKKDKEALETCILWQKNYPYLFQPNLELAKQYRTAGDKEKAILYLQKALVIDPGNSSAKELLTKM